MSSSRTAPVAIYVHVPFCPSKCGYCDFNSYALSGFIVDRTTDATLREIANSPWRGTPAKTIFFGGGTPTSLPAKRLAELLSAVIDTHPPIDGCEITSEANPGTVDASKFAEMRASGFNRVSIGAQSFDNKELAQLDRIHEANDIERALQAARAAGFDNVNLDLMFGLPHQSPVGWKRNLERAIELRPDHLSLYGLTIEPNTRFYKAHSQGKLELPDDDAMVRMYDFSLSATAVAGYEQYEISNFALPGRECAHNLCYWRHEPYVGYGPGAVGCMDGANVPGTPQGLHRTTNWKSPQRYCEAVEAGESICFEWEALDEDALALERIMLGIRLNEGLPWAPDIGTQSTVVRLSQRGWIEASADRIRLTPLGKRFCSSVALELAMALDKPRQPQPMIHSGQ